MAGDRGTARRLLDEATAITPALDHYPASMGLIQARAIHALAEGDLVGAEAASLEGARSSREVGDLYYLERMLMHLGVIALASGDHAGSDVRLREGLRVAVQLDNRLEQSAYLHLLGGLAAIAGQPRAAARMLGAADALAAAAGTSMAGPIEAESARAREAAIAALGAARFEAEYRAGMLMDREAAIRMALGEPSTIEPDAGARAGTAPLSRREVEVARLIAEGLGNREIGARLFIAERTVTTHVGNILNKLGFDSRVQIASWITSAGT
jgi:DNA-binding NarL/FixJ family response regulator